MLSNLDLMYENSSKDILARKIQALQRPLCILKVEKLHPQWYNHRIDKKVIGQFYTKKNDFRVNSIRNFKRYNLQTTQPPTSYSGVLTTRVRRMTIGLPKLPSWPSLLQFGQCQAPSGVSCKSKHAAAQTNTRSKWTGIHKKRGKLQ